MPRKRKLSDLSDRCRLCLVRDACMSQLFTDWIRPKLEDLEKCSAIKVSDKPNYPKSICYVCLYKLEMWSQFKSQFLKTNKTIVTHFKVIDQSISESHISKIIKYENTADDLYSEDNKKRLKLNISEPEPVPMLEISQKETDKLIPTDPVSIALAKFVEDINSDSLLISNDSNMSFVSKTIDQISTTATVKRKVGRPKKIEREASTKRWVERKNALIAATGSVPSESDSDTGPHLSPVQKARAKTNDKDPDKQKKIDKALKNLEMNVADKYKINQEDAINDERTMRTRKTNVDDQIIEVINIDDTPVFEEKKLENVKIEIKEKEMENEVIMEKNDISDTEIKFIDTKKIEETEFEKDVQKDLDSVNLSDCSMNIDLSQDIDIDFKPQLVTSEVVVGNATYVITTVLDLPNASSSKSDISLKTNGISIDATNQDGRKIDLMNAIKLQRVNPNDDNSFIKQNSNIKPSDVQKCLKIEIEGLEIEALQRVQLELAHFVNEDVRKRLFEDNPDLHNLEIKPMKFKNSYETLEYQLKSIIEKVLRNNYDSEVLTPAMCSNHQKISHEFAKAAERSPIFQPRVILTRMNLGLLCRMYHVSNLHLLEAVKRQRGLVGPLSRTLGKRRHVLPKKYDDFALTMNVIPSDEESTDKKTKRINAKLGPTKAQTSPKITQFVLEALGEDGSIVIDDGTCTSPTIVDIPLTIVAETLPNNKPIAVPLITTKPLSVGNTTLTPLPSLVNRTPIVNCMPPVKKMTATSKATKPSIVSSTPKPLKRQRHICGICGKELFSKEEAEAHVKNHKVDAGSGRPGSEPTTKSKPKLMRCKRCQAIVEARHVKSHVCNSVKYNCNLCECTFGVEHLLEAHLETHAQYKIRQEAANKASASKSGKTLKEVQRVVVVQENNEVHKIAEPVPDEELEIALSCKEPQGYSCFVCDKIFVDEEQMKDHLQMHCEEVSDEGNEKGFQCAFCGEKFQTEESLEMHVGSHLHEDSDDKINLLISMESRRDKQKRAVFRCERCSESFASSLLLATHLPLHEEEDAMLAEYEKQDVEQEAHVCTICDEVFDTADELSDHLDVHNGNVHVCILCEKPFSSIRDLQEHVSTHL
ncbi:PREDICTED: uncharacterized protein LOC105360389 [Ceratosolen solmsi marchali]|uniref:Uncharacterized protein LOC105360389 n=1 Tax=Ceratosolen solmsi marchali TaxID=326594 RepID=A0AAJ6VN06_9HYME|nr:PREDICTED: uncharacterized protein LOC105360389 [Ceratosolen solmsi marchali]